MKHTAILASVVLLATLLVLPGCGRDRGADLAAGPDGPPPTVVLIFIDTLRADRLGCYGNERDTSPNLDRLASESIVFDSAISQASWTLPSFFATFSGQHVQCLWNKAGERSLPTNLPLLGDYFFDAGYTTAGFVDVARLTRDYGFASGFELWDDEPRDGTAALSGRALEWLDRVRDVDRRFLLLHAFDVHGPFDAPAPFDTLFVSAAQLEEPAPGEGVPVHEKNHVFDHIPKYQHMDGRRNLDYYVSRYDGGIRWVDGMIGSFLDSLKSRGLYDDALIVVTSDHGESLSEHRFYLDHGMMYDDILRVPLIVKLPHGAGGGKRIAGQVQLIDLLPTFLDVLQVEPTFPLAGRSLLPVIDGRETETAEWTYSMEGIMHQWVIRSNEWKYARLVPGSKSPQAWRTCPWADQDDKKAVREFLFHLAEDGGETVDVSREHPEMTARLSGMIDDWLEQQAALKQLLTGSSDVVIDEKTRRELQALGYLGD